MNRPLTAHRYQTASVQTVLKVLSLKYLAGYKQFYPVFRPGAPMITVQEALQAWPPELLALRGWQVGPVRFYGGPPGIGKWYFGSVATMLYDAVLYKQTAPPCSRGLPLSFDT